MKKRKISKAYFKFVDIIENPDKYYIDVDEEEVIEDIKEQIKIAYEDDELTIGEYLSLLEWIS